MNYVPDGSRNTLWAPYYLVSFPIRIPLQWFHNCYCNCPLSYSTGQTKSVTYSEFVCVASIIQRAVSMRHIVYSSIACFGFTVFFHIINGTIFGKTLLNRKYVVIFSTTFIENISLSKKNSARYDQKCVLVFT